jgi:DNA-3-methyladenine glycosylase
MSRAFFERPTLDVAHDLIGKVLVHRVGRSQTSGVIVEVEAYIGESDPACHAAAGQTQRNTPLYGPPGRAYVYLNYGLHCLFNVVTERPGAPAAVLIRALDPCDGLEHMERRRRVSSKGRRRAEAARSFERHELCRGPGNLSAALGITLSHNGADLEAGGLYVQERGLTPGPVVWGPRVGISRGTDRPWRAWVQGHPAVSRPGIPRRSAGPVSSKMAG